LHTDYGHLHSSRLVLLGVLAIVLARALQSDARRLPLLAPVLGVAIVWTFSDAGHGATTSPAWLSVGADMLHVTAMATWIGGLIMLALAVLPRRDPDELRDVLPRFSTVAFVAVAVLVASGTYAAFRGIGTVDAIFTTTYGLLVVAKVALLAGILLVANLSRRLVRRRTVAYAMTDALVVDEPDVADDEVAIERLRRSVLVEAVIGLGVLVLSAVLVAEPRGKEALLVSHREPVSASAPLGGGRSIQVTAAPGTHGFISFTVAFSDGRSPQAVSATAIQHEKEIGPLPIDLIPEGAGLYDGSAVLPAAGEWELDFSVTTGPFDATTTDTTIRLH
jgi:copper transport protein